MGRVSSFPRFLIKGSMEDYKEIEKHKSTLCRAKCRQSKRWLYANITNGFNEFDIIEETIGRYTGITSSIGNDVFEDDVVLCDIPELNIKGLKFHVRYYNGGFNVFILGLSGIDPIYISDVNVISVINSIHD